MALTRPTSVFYYHVHSDYSLLDSATDFKEYVDLVKESGGTAIASTEHGLPRGWISKKLYCDKMGLKFVHGVEIYLTEQLEPKVRDNYHTVLLAKNEAGIRELNKLVSISSDKAHSYYTNRITFEEFLGISDNIIKTSACLASPLNKLSEDNPWYERLLCHYDYLEVQPHNHPDQIAFNQKLARFSKKYGIPLVAGTDTHSSSKYKAECRNILLKAKRQSYGDEDAFDLSYKTVDELLDMFAVQGALTEEEYFAAIQNTNEIAAACEDFSLDGSIKYPMYDITGALQKLEALGIPREDSALGLPLGMTTKIVDKRNVRNLMDMSHQRMCSRAYHEYRHLFDDIRAALSEYSDEWKYIVDHYLMPKCKYMGFCKERYTCGMMPRRQVVEGE